MNSTHRRTALLALLLLALHSLSVGAQEVVMADSSRWAKPDMEQWLNIPGSSEYNTTIPNTPNIEGLRMPSLPELAEPETNAYNKISTQRLSPWAIKAMTLNPTDLQLMGAVTQPRFSVDPQAYDYKRSGILFGWRSGFIGASGSQQTMIGLMTTRNASFSATQVAGRWVFTATADASNYQYGRGGQWQFGIGASATYVFSPNVSATVFGNYYTNTTFAGLSTMSYMGSSNYGGFMTLKNDRLGIDLGVEREFNPYTGRWETVPIVTPKVRIVDNFTISLPVGYLIKEAIDGPITGKRRGGNGIIKPQTPVINPRFTPPPGPQNNY